ncbi:MAG TPA: UDP-N-acetylmuramate dehydrogenase [Candidatus Paceibacterota bacterium]
MKIQENIPLKPFISMYVGGPARYFVEIYTEKDLFQALHFAEEKGISHFILGGGSNTLVSDKGFYGLVIRINILGKRIISETHEFVEIEVSAGENWDEFVAFAVEHGLYGIENMSHVPGSVGASVVQNIGCYGQEVSESVVSVNLINTQTFERTTFIKSDMLFSYRKSRLNDSGLDKGKYVVMSIVFHLKKDGGLNMSYADVKRYFDENPDVEPTLKTVRQAIINIRDSKFPFPDSPKNGTVGSFWNIDVVDGTVYDHVIDKLKSIGFDSKANEMINKRSVFAVAQGYKLTPGLFVEVLGFRGRSVGGAKVLEKHGGIINNFTGTATAKDIFELSKIVASAVYKEFGVKMKIEPELVGEFD